MRDLSDYNIELLYKLYKSLDEHLQTPCITIKTLRNCYIMYI